MGGIEEMDAAQLCPSHGLPLKYFCETDRLGVCAECIAGGLHRQHPYLNMEEACKKRKRQEQCFIPLQRSRSMPPSRSIDHLTSGIPSCSLEQSERQVEMREKHRTEVYDMSGDRLALTMCVTSGRSGAEADILALNKLFFHLGFVNKIIRNPTGEGFRKELLAFRGWIESRDSCLSCCFVVLMAHGSPGTLIGIDGATVKLEQLFQAMDNQNCPALRGKPKIFLIQACRGEQEDPGIVYTTDALSHLSKILPTHTDSLFIYPSQEGYVSYRSETEGSLLIQKLVTVFLQGFCEFHILELLTKVIWEVSGLNITSKDRQQHKSTPLVQYSLRKLLYLKPSGMAA
ncbi:caspase-14 [Rhinatrema bivittatum]|uniref:caspase-14 n=1 Tax=Rhinatrema bivittatum TaxID=194408 RepID=UPI00112BD5E2|nr:caspase-14 [Rhinatrema bivittatum]XP_029462782.1 caspase-14 [Rhinatrema bivittatum]XP_029462783.1 caspase-14 [Rhinatrema bivittatum]XP_029462784.1 caspase-14 [Rhinatrema bivittatum]XP_029462785.1 caspase-14 [Rhinatrema bivittatum]XP_029462787.1 caspase-14 [Rhinatrema bivittatum]XP_029462788.1 caspase-14 [Rhinatrema bivittatum]XP_029462789.1 caspase-14 [Rhinatrema bivittatum]